MGSVSLLIVVHYISLSFAFSLSRLLASTISHSLNCFSALLCTVYCPWRLSNGEKVPYNFTRVLTRHMYWTVRRAFICPLFLNFHLNTPKKSYTRYFIGYVETFLRPFTYWRRGEMSWKFMDCSLARAIFEVYLLSDCSEGKAQNRNSV